MGIPVYEVAKDFFFSAAHQIRMHGGKCERIHGHNWRVRIYARAKQLNAIGMVIDFTDLQRITSGICARFDHRHINEVAPFDQLNTTAENLARFFYEEANQEIAKAEGDRVRVSKVEIWESEASLAVYYEE